MLFPGKYNIWDITILPWEFSEDLYEKKFSGNLIWKIPHLTVFIEWVLLLMISQHKELFHSLWYVKFFFRNIFLRFHLFFLNSHQRIYLSFSRFLKSWIIVTFWTYSRAFLVYPWIILPCISSLLPSICVHNHFHICEFTRVSQEYSVLNVKVIRKGEKKGKKGKRLMYQRKFNES